MSVADQAISTMEMAIKRGSESKVTLTEDEAWLIFNVLNDFVRSATVVAYWHGEQNPISYNCGNCRHSLQEGFYHCPGCGKRIQWLERKEA